MLDLILSLGPMFLCFWFDAELRRDNPVSSPTNPTNRTTRSPPDSRNHYHTIRLHNRGQGTPIDGRVDKRFDERGVGLLEHRMNESKLTKSSNQTSDRESSADSKTLLYNRHRRHFLDRHLHNAGPLLGHFQSVQYFVSSCHHSQVRLCAG